MQSHKLVDSILQKGVPDSDQTFPPLRMSLSLQMPIKTSFDQLVEEVLRDVCTHKSEKYRKPNRELIRLLLANLIHAAFRFENLSIPTKVRSGSYYHNLDFSQDRIERIRDVLLQKGLMRLNRVGYRHWGNPEKSRPAQYFPTKKLLEAYDDILYAEHGDFSSYCPYEYRDESNRWDPNEAVSSAILVEYNQMMQSHSWAMKAPTVRKLGLEPFTGGRVYTHYQNIVNRRIPIRSQTLLDGEPLVECDFTSNHPYLLAKLTGNDFDSDAYQLIADRVSLDRKSVKSIITQTIGARSPKDLGSVKYNLHQIGSSKIDEVIDATAVVMPWLRDSMFNDQGVKLQWLEGEIAIRMFKDATEMNMPMICVHDAYAVNHKNKQLTEELMNHHREEVIKLNKHRWAQHSTALG